MESNFREQFERVWYAPAFSSILTNRSELAIFAGISVAHLGLSLFGYSVWRCPILAATGIPCPGCGLTTAMLELLHGDVLQSLRTHAFAPVILLGVSIALAAFLLPPKPRDWLISTYRKLETRNGITAWVLLGLMLYYGIRMMGLVPFPSFLIRN
jgi:hypothetical protein